jgi:hypothetical protein
MAGVILELRPITIDGFVLDSTNSRDPYDRLAAEMLARAGMMCEQVIAAVRRATPPSGLDIDQAVVGGLLVRVAKLLRGTFDAAQAAESDAHLLVSRSVAETAVTLMWLVKHGDVQSRRRFRADSFVYWREQLGRMDAAATEGDPFSVKSSKQLRNEIELRMARAGVSWDDVPRRASSWGPNVRQQCEQLDLAWIYSLFAGHSSYVHPSWHELCTFHLRTVDDGFELDETFSGMAPIVGYVLGRLGAEVCRSAAGVLPHDLDPKDLEERVSNTVEASHHLSLHFSDYMQRHGFEAERERTSLQDDA